MPDTAPDKDHLISRILDIEEHMFTTVPHEPGGGCSQGLSGFRVHRKSLLLTWSTATLASYLDDLHKAQEQGKNLMTLKYARMGEQIGPLTSDPLLEQINRQKLIWQREAAAKFPRVLSQGRPLEEAETDREAGVISFATYSRCELETYSSNTRRLLWRDMQGYLEKGINMSELIYRNLASAMGYGSLEDAEAAIAAS
jgi:hypothetical protein